MEKVFPKKYVAVILGGREENNYLLDETFDYIFFTGSKSVGIMVLEKAAPHVTPVTLELGGKSPCIIDSTAKLKLAAKRIIFGKYLNCGQTCVAPDYILCHKSVKDEFITYIIEEIKRQYGEKANRETQKIEPTVMENVTFEDDVMKEEIFGPIMPILTFNTIEEVIDIVNEHEKPLALYLFAENKGVIKEVTTKCVYGGGCINDVVIHLVTSHMGFGGVGESGMGSYHGKTGFDTFSHYKSIVDKKTIIDLPMKYQPYKECNRKLIKMFMK